MNREKDVIQMINGLMPRSNLQENKLFEADSEILNYGKEKLLFTIDEFSSEDMFRENDPYTLGWNIAVGSISNILASGGNPKFFATSLSINKKWSRGFIKKFYKGIKEVLVKTKTSFIGGDFGISDEYRCNVAVIGFCNENPMIRSKAKAGDQIYITGKIGAGNLEAALKLYENKKILKLIKNRFKVRIKESTLIKKYSGCAIDTSDGLFKSLNIISDLSKTGYIIKDIPYIEKSNLFSKLFNVPKQLLFFGECGEYELLFTISKEKENDFLIEAKSKKLRFYRIGEIVAKNERMLFDNDRKINLKNFNISGRDYEDKREYIKDIIKFINKGN